MDVSDEMRDTALHMLGQLERQRLEVELAPSLDDECALRGGKIRVVTGHNPDWYRKFCNQYPPSRSKPRQGKRGQRDTRIKRNHTIRALNEIIAGRCETEYAQRLFPFVEAQMRYINKMIMQGRLFFEVNMKFKKIPVFFDGIDRTTVNDRLPSGFAQVRYQAQYNGKTDMNRIVNAIVVANTVGDAAAAAGRLEQILAVQELGDILKFMTCITIMGVLDLTDAISDESGGLILSEVS